MLEDRWTLARGCKSGFSDGTAAAQDRPDLRREPELLQTPGQPLSHPWRPLPGSAARNGDQDPAVEARREATVSYRLQPHLGNQAR